MMNPEEVRSTADAIWEMRNPTRIKMSEVEKLYAETQFKTRVEQIDTYLADIADEKELKEVYAL